MAQTPRNTRRAAIIQAADVVASMDLGQLFGDYLFEQVDPQVLDLDLLQREIVKKIESMM